jgi:multidrug transporter EmrE-like cation transporter
VITLLCGALLFGEQVSALRIAGTVLICAGVILVGRSA